MAKKNSFSIISIDDNEAGKTLVEKIAEAFGWIGAPWQVKRMAKAHVKADKIRLEGDIELADIDRRALNRWRLEQSQKQLNIENTISNAVPLLSNNSTPHDIDNDWIVQFFGFARNISDEDIQLLWSRVLAGEANAPGSFSKRTLRILSELEKEDGDMFSNVCNFIAKVGMDDPVVFNSSDDLYIDAGVTFESIAHLDTIGLIEERNFGFVRHIEGAQHIQVKYFGESFQLNCDSLSRDKGGLKMGKIRFTEAGRQLATICQTVAVEGNLERLREEWKEHIANGDEGL